MLAPVETLCILGVNVKSLSVLVRKELTNCSAVLTLHRPLSFLPLKVAEYPNFHPTVWLHEVMMSIA